MKSRFAASPILAIFALTVHSAKKGRGSSPQGKRFPLVCIHFLADSIGFGSWKHVMIASVNSFQSAKLNRWIVLPSAISTGVAGILDALSVVAHASGIPLKNV